MIHTYSQIITSKYGKMQLRISEQRKTGKFLSTGRGMDRQAQTDR